MPVIVNFKQDAPGGAEQELGPYFCVEVTKDRIVVNDDFSIIRLANRNADGKWIVIGLEDMPFDSLVVMPPWNQAREDLATAAAVDDE